MDCCFLFGKNLLSCGADARPYIPSSFEIDEYCTSNRHKVCPLYFRVKSRGHNLPEDSSFSDYEVCPAVNNLTR